MSTTNYPQSAVWYIEARSTRNASDLPNMGSAVAIWLKPPGDNASPRKYLLTCNHVVRAKSSLGKVGSGALLKHVLAWPAGRGYVPFKNGDPWPEKDNDGVWTGTVIDVFIRPNDELAADQIDAASDWVLIDIQENDFQQYHSVRELQPEPATDVSIIGYPNGAGLWNPGTTVENYVATGFRQARSPETPALLFLEGPDETAAGMSGGGIFDSQSRFVGLHRSQSQAARSLGGITVSHIESVLSSRDYRLITTASPIPNVKLVNPFEEFKGFLTDVKTVSGLSSKVFLAAPMLDMVCKIGPPLTNRLLIAFCSIAIQIVVLLFLFESNRWKGPTTRWFTILFAASCISSLAFVFAYVQTYNLRVHEIRSQNPDGSASTRTIISGAEFTDVGQAFEGASPEVIMRDFESEADVWTVKSIEAAKRFLVNAWLGIWASLALLYGSFILLQNNRKVEVQTR